jgi:iron complex transport system permease protein
MESMAAAPLSSSRRALSGRRVAWAAAVLAVLLSLAVGARPIAPSAVLDA